MKLTLDQINAAPGAEFASLLDGTYEHSPWIAELRLDDKFGYTPELGDRVFDWAERLAR